MKTITVEGYKVNICIDIMEWGREFYGIPEEATIDNLDNAEELQSECMGFAEPINKEIYIFIPLLFEWDDLCGTVAHEVGHCMTKVPRSIEGKANWYEDFYLLVSKIIDNIVLVKNEVH